MPKRSLAAIFFLCAVLSRAETHSLTLQQTLELAGRQNPDITLARLDERRAQEGIRVAQDPFHPKVYLSSGAAYTYGYPNSIQGNAPSIFQVTTQESLYNRPQSYGIAAAKERARASQYGAQAKNDEVVYQAADVFLTAIQIDHQREAISNQLPSLQKVVAVMSAAVNEGSELPLELQRARVNLAMSQEQFGAAELDEDYYQTMLAVVVGYPASDRVKPVDSDLPSAYTPSSEQEAADMALRNNRELRQTQANILARQMDLRSYKAARLPQIDLVAQYALFAKYNYEQYFPTHFQRNNFQLGASFTVPLLIGTARQGYLEQANTDMLKLRVQSDQIRNRVLLDTRRSFQQWKKAESIRDLARMQLDLARQDLTVKLARNNEGRVPITELEQARLEESKQWIALYDSELQVTRAKLAILRDMGTLAATVQAGQSNARPDVIRP
ncbi:MAG: TolC family protein [Acidobacteriales bacterium]|nr:TolC family protein [Terriglobales bacterium]